MRTSELHAKLLTYLKAKRDAQVMEGLQPISPGVDIKYEAGRRIGNRIGMDYMLERAMKFFTDQDQKDEDL
jgi:hypothetical protein